MLGTVVTFDNSAELELQQRICKAWRAFLKHKHILCCRTAPIPERLKLLQSLVGTTLFWCSGSWNLTVKQVSRLMGAQQAMLRKMLPLRKRPLESDEKLMERTGAFIKLAKSNSGFTDFDSFYFRQIFTWAGHLVRMKEYDENRMTSRVFCFRNSKWIKDRAAKNSGNQMHGRKVAVWRWEQRFDKFFGNISWQETAQSRCSWHSRLEEFVRRRQSGR